MAIMECRGLSKRFGKVQALEGVDLKIDNTNVKEQFRDYLDKLAKQCG